MHDVRCCDYGAAADPVCHRGGAGQPPAERIDAVGIVTHQAVERPTFPDPHAGGISETA
jgi:hypothetical protein